jgi:o-succinylbenzoate synthase
MLPVARITLREIRLPLREPFRISSGVTTTRRLLLVELEDGEGTAAWSECVAGEHPNYSPETIDGAWLIVRDHLAPRLLNRSFPSAAAIYEELARDVRGHPMARAALEMGCWELQARRENRSLSDLLGGERSRVEVGVSLGIQDTPELLAEKAGACFARGYRRVKLKIMPGSDLPWVRIVREALGPRAALTVDANAAYSLGDLDLFRALDALGLGMIEQPLAVDDLLQHARLQRELTTPLCLDESIGAFHHVISMAELGSGRIVNIKPGRVGGFTPSRKIHDFCRIRGIPVWCGGMLESGVGRGHNVALASLAHFILPGDISPSRRYWERDIVTPEWSMEPDGTMRVPLERPGIGVEVDRDRVEDLTVRTEIVAAT